MGKLTCGCLNVKIHTKRSDLTAATPAQLGLSSDFVEGFFSLQITDAPLDLEGLRIEQPCLVKQKSVGEWIVNRCHNCDMYTHATHATHGTSRVLVNCSLKNDPNIQERYETSADFSPLFKIVLPNQIDNRPMGTVGVQSDRYDQVETTLKSIQERLNSYISSEEAAVENRIREYQQQQKAAFAELQSKARRDKNAMINLVLSAQQEELNDSGNTSPLQLSTQSSQTSVTSPMSITSTSSESNTTQESKVVKSSKTDFSFLKQPNVKMSETAGVKNKRTFFPAKPGHGNDDELFDMEGLHDMDDVRPFYNSDDENDTDDSNSLNDEGIVPHVTNSNQRQLYSSSVPISVPSWTDYRQRNSSIDEDDEEDDRVPPPNPENMAASISALARSVHTDTSDIFGERPRRKVSVLDMGRR